MTDVFNPVDLWVLPTPSFSRWFSQLDWYLNWQMCKGMAYGGLHLPSETHRLAEEYGFAVKAEASSKGGLQPPLLIAPSGRVPTKRCLVLDGADDPKSWLATISQHVSQLKSQEIRVFLPKGFNKTSAEKIWKAHDCKAHFTEDLEAVP